MRPVHGGNLAWAAALAGCPPSLILDFSASINPLGPPESALAAIYGHLEELKAYPDPQYGKLRSRLSQFHELPSEWILPGNGAAELLTWVGWDFSLLVGTYLVTPAFGDYYRALRAFKAEIVEFPLDLGDRSNSESPLNPRQMLYLGKPQDRTSSPRLEDFDFCSPRSSGTETTLRGAKKGFGLLLNNPHNPTGRLFAKAEILPYLEQFALVVVDEAFMDFLPPDKQESLISVVQDYPNLVILRSLTKFYSLPGLRLGYAIAHPDRLKVWKERRDPWTVNVLAAAVGEAVVQDREFQQQTWDWLEATRGSLFKGIASLEGLQPLESAANFILVQTQCSASQLQERLLKGDRILIRDCLSFAQLGDRYFRVAVRTDAENQRLLSGLATLLKH